MGMNRGHKDSNSNKLRKHEEEFLCDYKQAFNDIPEIDIVKQKESMINAIEHIKRARDYGIDKDVLKDMLLFNNSNFIDLIKEPNINDFYQYRTYMALSKVNVQLYIKEIIESRIDIYKYATEHASDFSANIKNNYITFLCRMIQDIVEAEQYTDNKEMHDISEKIKNNALTMDDYKVVCKFIDQYLEQMKIGKAEMWNNLKKNPEECRKMLVKNKNILFDVRKLELNKKQKNEISQEKENVGEILNHTSPDRLSVTNYATNMKNDNLKVVTFRKYNKPFISQNKEESFLTCMSCVLSKADENTPKNIYKVIEYSENEKNPTKKAQWRRLIYDYISKIEFCGTIFSAKKCLKNRIAAAVNYLYSSDSLRGSCDRNNSRLRFLGLDALNIEQEELVSKFVKGGNESCVYYYNEDTDISKMSNGTVFSDASDEIIIALSAFYTNRMAKQFRNFVNLSYIFNKKEVIDRIYDEEDFEYKDIGLSDDELCKYMALYDVLREKISRKIGRSHVRENGCFDDKFQEEIYDELSCYSNICKKIEGKNKIDFKQDIDIITVDAISMGDMYKLKEFSVKSLIYTANTDECKNILNWGYVSEEKGFDNFILLGFDVKGLNMPIFMHMKKSEVIELMSDITGKAIIPVYEGNKDMNIYSTSKRMTGQVIYPLSKDDKKIINKIDGNAAKTAYFKHIKWLANSNAKPEFEYKPGSRMYDIIKDIIVVNEKNTKEPVDIDGKEC